jgi:sugar-phosphatase
MQPVVRFHLDGLLIDSEPVWDAAKREVFGPLGLHLTTEMQAATRGMRCARHSTAGGKVQL